MRSTTLSLICTLTLAVLLCGCSIIMPKDAQMIDNLAGNAVAMSRVAAKDANLPMAYREWFAEDAAQWVILRDWAHGRKPASQPAGE